MELDEKVLREVYDKLRQPVPFWDFKRFITAYLAALPAEAKQTASGDVYVTPTINEHAFTCAACEFDDNLILGIDPVGPTAYTRGQRDALRLFLKKYHFTNWLDEQCSISVLNGQGWREMEVDSADFENNTITFVMPENYEVFAGTYLVMPQPIHKD